MSTIPPPYKASLVDNNKKLTPAWRSFHESIFETTGSSEGTLKIDGSNITSSVAAGDVRLKAQAPKHLYFNTYTIPQPTAPDTLLASNGSTGIELKTTKELGLGLQTGNILPSYRNDERSGFILATEGTIGSSKSNASVRANDDTENLYMVWWTTYPNEYAPVIGGRGNTAAEDWSDNKPLTIPVIPGRLVSNSGNGDGLPERTLGESTGAETHALTELEAAEHTHSTSVYNAGSTNTSILQFYTSGLGVQGPIRNHYETEGTGAPHNNVQPTTFINLYIKL